MCCESHLAIDSAPQGRAKNTRKSSFILRDMQALNARGFLALDSHIFKCGNNNLFSPAAAAALICPLHNSVMLWVWTLCCASAFSLRFEIGREANDKFPRTPNLWMGGDTGALSQKTTLESNQSHLHVKVSLEKVSFNFFVVYEIMYILVLTQTPPQSLKSRSEKWPKCLSNFSNVLLISSLQVIGVNYWGVIYMTGLIHLDHYL